MEEQATSSTVPASALATPFLGPIELLRHAWRDYTTHLSLYLGIFAVPTVVNILVLVSGQYITLSTTPLFIVANIIGGIITALGVIALLSALSRPEEFTFARAYRVSAERFFPYLWLMIISGFLVLGLTLLFVIPGIIVGVWFSMGLMVFIAEDERGMRALLKSKEYVRGRAWGVFGRSLFIGLLMAVLLGVVSALVAGATFGAGVPASGTSLSVAIVTNLLSLVLTPLLYGYFFGLYRNLRTLHGEVVIDARGTTKAKYVVPAVIGFLLVPIFIGSFFMYAARAGFPLPTGADLNELQRQMNLPVSGPESSLELVPDAPATPAI